MFSKKNVISFKLQSAALWCNISISYSYLLNEAIYSNISEKCHPLLK